MKKLFVFCISLAFFETSLLALDLATKDIKFMDPEDVPWLQGPLLTPSGYLVEVGHFDLQPYYNFTYVPGRYDKNWNYQKQDTKTIQSLFVPLKVGMTHATDLLFAFNVISNNQNNKTATHLGDTILGISFRLKEGDMIQGSPALRLSYRVFFPTGKYQHLNAKKANVDATSEGAFWQVLTLSTTKLWQLTKKHFLELRAAASYSYGPPVHVSGYNFYSTKLPLKAKVYNGNVAIFSSSLQYNLSKRVGVAFDALYKHKNKTRLKTQNGYQNIPSNDNFSLAPSIGYGFNENIGVLAGVWFSVLGRNSAKFTQGSFSLNIYY
jgi:hypothetical protein